MNSNNTVGPRPCGFERCPAFAVDGHEFCPVHSPSRVLDRARQIINNEFADALVQPISKASADLLIKLRADIHRDLDHTV